MTAEPGETFLAVIESHKGILYKIANAYCRNSSDRADIIQEIIFQLWRSFPNYNGQYRYSTWIYRVALNTAISQYRKAARQAGSVPLAAMAIEIADNDTDEESNAQLQLLQRFIGELPELDRALMLLYLEQKSYREIAMIIGITETNTATRLSRIKALLKKKFDNHHY